MTKCKSKTTNVVALHSTVTRGAWNAVLIYLFFFFSFRNNVFLSLINL